jgi:hypothetical protein
MPAVTPQNEKNAMHTDVKQEQIKKRVARSAYCVDTRKVAAAIIVRLALGDESSSAWRGGSTPGAQGAHQSRPAI